MPNQLSFSTGGTGTGIGTSYYLSANQVVSAVNYYYLDYAGTTVTNGAWFPTASTGTYTGTYTYALHPLEETAQQRAEREKREAARKAEQQRADQAAEELLRELIGENRYRVYKRNGHVVVSSRQHHGRLAYRIKAGQMISLLERRPQGGWRKRGDALCIHPLEKHPVADEVAALYVLARHDEQTLWRVANHHLGAAA